MYWNNWKSTNLDIILWDVEHGLSVTIITPYVANASNMPINRRRVIQFDLGSNLTNNFSPISYLSNKGLSTIDCLVVSHPDKDHINDFLSLHSLVGQGKLSVLTLLRNRTIPTHTISENQAIEEDQKKIFRHYDNKYNASCPTWHALSPFNFGGVSFYSAMVSYYDGIKSNDLSVLLLIQFGGMQIIIPGDLEDTGFNYLKSMNRMPSLSSSMKRFFVAPHHGSKTVKPANMLNHFNPHIVLASVERGNEYTDSLYSSEAYVEGYPVISSDGQVSTSKFCGTKGNSLHIQASIMGNPVIQKIRHI